MKKHKTGILLCAFLLIGSGLFHGCSRPPRGLDSSGLDDRASMELDYDVQWEDSWSKISEAFFGDAQFAERIAKDNKLDPENVPELGQTLKIRVRAGEMNRVRAVSKARGPYNAGVELMQKDGQQVQAVEAFENALELAPWFTDARYNLGLVLLRQGKADEALDHLEDVARSRPADKDAIYAVASACFHLNRLEMAVTHLEEALQLDPSFLRALYTYALALERLGRNDDARDAWQQYLEQDSSSAWAEEARLHLELFQ